MRHSKSFDFATGRPAACGEALAGLDRELEVAATTRRVAESAADAAIAARSAALTDAATARVEGAAAAARLAEARAADETRLAIAARAELAALVRGDEKAAEAAVRARPDPNRPELLQLRTSVRVALVTELEREAATRSLVVANRTLREAQSNEDRAEAAVLGAEGALLTRFESEVRVRYSVPAEDSISGEALRRFLASELAARQQAVRDGETRRARLEAEATRVAARVLEAEARREARARRDAAIVAARRRDGCAVTAVVLAAAAFAGPHAARGVAKVVR